MVREPEGVAHLSSTTLVRPHDGRRRRRPAALALSLAIGVAGLTAAATPADADAVVQISGPAGPVAAETPYIYTVTIQGVPNDVGISLTVDLMGAATFTGTSSDYCSFSGVSAGCEDFPSSSVTYTFTVLPTQAGDVTAYATAGGDVNGTDSTDTTIGPAPIPTVTSISPDSGPSAGGTPVTITGTNLAGTTEIDFGPAGDATDVSCTATACTAATPQAGPGIFDVQIFTPYGTNVISASDQYTYTPSITVNETETATGFGVTSTQPFEADGPGPLLLVAFVSSDGPAARQTATVAGAGLTWTLAERADTKGGTAEVWTAYTTGSLTDVTVDSVPRFAGYAQLLTVEVFSGASGVGAGAVAGKAGGAPGVKLTTTTADSWVFAVGEDYTHDTAITPGPGQGVLQSHLDTTNNDTFWVQNQNQITTAAGTRVTMGDTAPAGDTWNLAAVEILPSAS